MVHGANTTTAFLKAQAAQDFGEVKGLAQKVHGAKYEREIGGRPGVNGRKGRKGKRDENVPLGNGEIGVNTSLSRTCWTSIVINVIYQNRMRRSNSTKTYCTVYISAEAQPDRNQLILPRQHIHQA